jgi:hypothetical protein
MFLPAMLLGAIAVNFARELWWMNQGWLGLIRSENGNNAWDALYTTHRNSNQ